MLESFSLSLLGWGMAGALIAELAGRTFAYLPRDANGNGGDAESAGALLQLAPLLCAATGLAIVGFVTSTRAFARRWPAALAIAFGAAALQAVASLEHRWSFRAAPWWLQSYEWGRSWVVVCMPMFFAAAGAALCRRVLRAQGLATPAAAARVCLWIAIASAALWVGAGLHFRYAVPHYGPFNPSAPPPAGPLPTPPLVRSIQANAMLKFGSEALYLAGWSGAALLAFFTRALSQEARADPPHPPEIP
jgi:hypothetical protein